LIQRVSERYQPFGLRIWETVRGKLRHDPVYLGLLREGPLPREGRLVDLGCGRGLLLATLAAAREIARLGRWPEDWPQAPEALELIGYEIDPVTAAIARRALSEVATVHAADVREIRIPTSEAIVLLDVLHYLDAPDQEDLLAGAAAALASAGVLWIREADADGGLRFHLTRIQERLSAWSRGEWRRRFHYRSAAAWGDLLAGHGLSVETSPMAAGTPFANVLIAGRRPARRNYAAGRAASARGAPEEEGGTGTVRSSRR